MSVAHSDPYDWVQALCSQPLQTPAYVYSMPQLVDQMRALKQELGTPLLTVVAACSNPDVLARLPEDLRFGARCASRHEMNIVSAWRCENLFVGMPSLEAPSARAALGGRYKIVIDSPAQLETLAHLRGARHVGPVSLSLSSALAGAPPREGLQGMDSDGLEQALVLALRHGIVVGGLQMYAGRHGFDHLGMAVARTLVQLVPVVESRLGYPLQTINLGGGLEEDWWSRNHSFVEYRRLLEGFGPHLQLMHEIGRAIFAPAGAFLTRVVSTKRVAGQAVAICDGGRVQADGLTRSHGDGRGITPFLLRQDRPGEQAGTASGGEGTLVCGASAAKDDVLAQVAVPLSEGDLLAFPGAGAYMQSRSPTQFLGYVQAHSYVCS